MSFVHILTSQPIVSGKNKTENIITPETIVKKKKKGFSAPLEAGSSGVGATSPVECKLGLCSVPELAIHACSALCKSVETKTKR